MATKARKQLDEEIKARFVEGVSEHLTEKGEEVLRVKSNEIALPVVDSEGNEKFLVITFKVPTGSRDGEEYDGFSMAEDYRMTCENKKAKAEERAKKAKEEKAKREAKKAEREAKKASES